MGGDKKAELVSLPGSAWSLKVSILESGLSPVSISARLNFRIVKVNVTLCIPLIMSFAGTLGVEAPRYKVQDNCLHPCLWRLVAAFPVWKMEWADHNTRPIHS